MPVFVSLARIGYWATVASILIATFTYPLAYLKRTRQAIEGTRPHGVSRAMSGPITLGGHRKSGHTWSLQNRP
jgi:hypothetical protein